MKLLFVLSAFLLVGSAMSMSCTLDVDGAHFDLSELEKRQDYTVLGGDLTWTSQKEEKYKYQFGLCKNVVKERRQTICNDEGEVDAAVYQVGPVGTSQPESCHVAGKISEQTKLQLQSKADPSLGLFVNYTDGSQCHHDHDLSNCDYTGSGTSYGKQCPKRRTAIFFECADAEAEPGEAIEVNSMGQPSHCEYVISMRTMHACPSECGRAYNSDMKRLALCAGHGICGWDKSNNKAKCFCDDGYGGNDCNSSASSGTSETVVGLLVILLLVTIGLAGVVVFMYKQVRAYRMDATNYMQIRGQEMADQMSTI